MSGEYENELADLTVEVKKIYRLLEVLRKNENGQIEFGITTCKGNVEWFPCYRLPYEAEKYINAWLKINNSI